MKQEREQQPELTGSEGQNVMPALPKIERLGREFQNKKGELRQTIEAAKKEMAAIEEKILAELVAQNRASYVLTDVDGRRFRVERREMSARLKWSKIAAAGSGRTRRKR